MLQKAKDFMSDFESEKFGKEDVISMLYLFGSKIKIEQEEEIEDWKACHEHQLDLMKGLNDRIADLEKQILQWHDLRKDPNDLPRQGVELLVSVDGYTRTAMYSKETNSFTCQEGVIAWMYEPEFI